MEKCRDIFPYGSRWVRADFHLHTKADREFVFSDDENYYYSNYVVSLQQANIEIGVVTNHNKFDFEEFKALKKTAREKNIFLLPGVELSIGDGSNGIHTLIVFSDEWLTESDYINSFLQVAFEGKTPNQYENENGRTSLGLLDTIKKLQGYNKDFFLVFAHVEDKSGLWNELNGGRLSELGKSELFTKHTLGFQKVRTHDHPDRKCRVKVQNWLADAYPAEVEGSDPKSIDKIGKGKKSYLKIGEFTFEAVKYALLDYQHRLATEPPKYEHSYIKSVYFEGGVLSGKTINFSSELNTLIGIRGSGKSSILEAIRYVLDIPFGEKSQDIKYKNELVNHVLGSGGKIILRAIDQRGQEYEVRRINREKTDVYVNGILQPGISICETVLHKPIYFGQKDLSSTGDGFEKDLVEKIVGDKLAEIRRKIFDQGQKVVDIVGKLKKISSTEERKKEFEAQKANAECKLKFYKDHGVEEKLQKQVTFEADARKCSQVLSFVKNYLGELDAFIGQHEDDLRNQKIYTSKENVVFFGEFFACYEKLIASFEQIKVTFTLGSHIHNELKQHVMNFLTFKDSLKEEFAEIERNLAGQLKDAGVQAIKPEEFRTLRTTVDQATQMLQAIEKEATSRNALEIELLAELATLNALWHEEFQAVKSELENVNRNNASLSIESEYKGNKESYIAFMKDMFRGSNIREIAFRNLAEHFVDFVEIYKNMENAKKELASSAQTFEQYYTTNLESLLTWQVPTRFIIKYRGKELKEHSLGQRASALILFVLSQRENNVYLIDQPEDDLDNKTIYEDVIKLVRQLKQQTQFIFATHNANFPVLGDAEQIISCSYIDDTIQTKCGSIDCHLLQQEIVNIMEGGEEAFNQRKRKYEIWKPQSLLKS